MPLLMLGIILLALVLLFLFLDYDRKRRAEIMRDEELRRKMEPDSTTKKESDHAAKE